MTKQVDLRPGEWRVKGWKRAATRAKPLASQVGLWSAALCGILALASIVGMASQWGIMPPQAASQSVINTIIFVALAAALAAFAWVMRSVSQSATEEPVAPSGGLTDAWLRRLTIASGIWAACVLQFYPDVYRALYLPGWLGFPLMAAPGFSLFLYAAFTDRA